MIKIPKKYNVILELYKKYSYNICDTDYLNFDVLAKEEIFVWESLGKTKFEEIFNRKEIYSNNGYYWGKVYFDITVSMMREDIKLGILFSEELDDNIKKYIV